MGFGVGLGRFYVGFRIRVGDAFIIKGIIYNRGKDLFGF